MSSTLGRKTSRFLVVSTNFGGPRTADAMKGQKLSRPAALASVIATPNSALPPLPTVATLQEMSRLLDLPVDFPRETINALDAFGPRSFYAPAVTTNRYPLPRKWSAPGLESVRQMEQGMTTLAIRHASLHAPDLEPHHTGMVLDLPIVRFIADAGSEPRGLIQETDIPNTGLRLKYRHTRYLGNRDTEPRIATAHRVRLPDPSGGEFVLFNVHLATLLEENTHGRLRVQRRPTLHATALRYLQLDVILQHIESIYNDLRLPVVVAGDFNACPKAEELVWFCQQAGLDMCFPAAADHCWKCGNAIPQSPQIELYTGPGRNSILTQDPAEFKNLTTETPGKTPVTEWCRDCSVPLFTHKRNFSLIDNILFTGANASEEFNLRAGIKPTPDRGIRLDTYFSDHLPIWSTFDLIPTR